MEQWRRVMDHDGYFVAELRLCTREEGGRGRAVQSGYHASWWRVVQQSDEWIGSGPMDLLEGRRSIVPGQQGLVRVHPMDPSAWRGVTPGAELHLREREDQTLGVARVLERVRVPDEAPLRLDRAPSRGIFLTRAPSEADRPSRGGRAPRTPTQP